MSLVITVNETKDQLEVIKFLGTLPNKIFPAHAPPLWMLRFRVSH